MYSNPTQTQREEKHVAMEANPYFCDYDYWLFTK